MFPNGTVNICLIWYTGILILLCGSSKVIIFRNRNILKILNRKTKQKVIDECQDE